MSPQKITQIYLYTDLFPIFLKHDEKALDKGHGRCMELKNTQGTNYFNFVFLSTFSLKLDNNIHYSSLSKNACF